MVNPGMAVSYLWLKIVFPTVTECKSIDTIPQIVAEVGVNSKSMFNVCISDDCNILEIYLQISHIFLAIVVKHLRYTA
jgi:hypothetical protein